MKTKFHYSIVCALIIALSACSSKLNTSSSSSAKAFPGQALDEKDMSLNSGKTLLNVMQEKIKGFDMQYWPMSNAPRAGLTGGRATGFPFSSFSKKMNYTIFGKELHLVIDGTDVERFYVSDTPEPDGQYMHDRNGASSYDRRDFIKSILINMPAEDVKGIKVISDSRTYKSDFASKYGVSSSALTDFAYVEVTTKSGNGYFTKTASVKSL